MTEDATLDETPPEADIQAHADAAMARGEHEKALRLWSEARTRFPAAPRPWLRTAEIMAEKRRFTEAEAVLDEAVSRFPDNFWLLRTRALIVRGQGDDIEAYTRCRALRQSYPDNPVAHADLAHLLLDLKQVAAAEAEAKVSLALFPDHKWLLHMYARCADLTGDVTAAAARWTDLLIRHPDHELAYPVAARALIGTGRLDEAAGIAREGLALFPNGGAACEAWVEVGKVTTRGGRVASIPDSAEMLLASALGAERNGQWPEAAHHWALLRAQTPLALAYARGARALLRVNRMAEAEIVLAKARRDLPPDPGVLEVWADAAVQRNAFEDALARFHTLRQAFASALHADLGIARALYQLVRLGEADVAYARLTEDQRSNVLVAQQYALIATERRDWLEAIGRWTRMAAAFPDHLPAYWHKADAFIQAGRVEEADAVLSDAVLRFPGDLETALRWSMLGDRGGELEDGSPRSEVLCRRFPGVAPVIRRDGSSARSGSALALATSQ
jgi:tetratricopeptide (TPR) repeat protein